MELTWTMVAILTVNLAVFLGGCVLAAYRTWGPPARALRRSDETERDVPR